MSATVDTADTTKASPQRHNARLALLLPAEVETFREEWRRALAHVVACTGQADNAEHVCEAVEALATLRAIVEQLEDPRTLRDRLSAVVRHRAKLDRAAAQK